MARIKDFVESDRNRYPNIKDISEGNPPKIFQRDEFEYVCGREEFGDMSELVIILTSDNPKNSVIYYRKFKWRDSQMEVFKNLATVGTDSVAHLIDVYDFQKMKSTVRR